MEHSPEVYAAKGGNLGAMQASGRRPIARAILSEAVDLEFDSGSSYTKDLRKLVFTASCLALSINDSVKTKPAIPLVVSLEKTLNGIPPSSVVKRW